METVPCFLCGADRYEVIYEARHDREKDADLIQKFRASGDELLIDQLVRCTSAASSTSTHACAAI